MFSNNIAFPANTRWLLFSQEIVFFSIFVFERKQP